MIALRCDMNSNIIITNVSFQESNVDWMRFEIIMLNSINREMNVLLFKMDKLKNIQIYHSINDTEFSKQKTFLMPYFQMIFSILNLPLEM